MVCISTRGILVFLLVLVGLWSPKPQLNAANGPTVPVAKWIWQSENGSTDQRAVFQKSFALDGAVRKATLSVIVDFCAAEVSVNGSQVAVLEPYTSLQRISIPSEMLQAKNLLSIHADSMDGPSAVALQMDCQLENGGQTSVATDASWQVASDTDTINAKETGSLAAEAWIDWQGDFGVSALEDYTQWKQALGGAKSVDPAAFVVLPQFEIELLHSAKSSEGSWVAMAFEPQGRLVIAKESKGLLRMTLSKDGDRVQKVELIDDQLLECRGLLFANDALYVNANNSKALYELRDTDGDDQFDQRKAIYKSNGSVGHGRNDLTLGPEGRIYLIHGDSVELPRNFTDRTSPFREHTRGVTTREGHVLSFDADGMSPRLETAGLRNPFGIAFNRHGDAFTYDADAEFDMGAPWYRPTRINHLVPGGDYGWRGVTGQWPPYFPDHPDNAVPNLDIGKGSPTSVKFGYQSSFPQLFRDALYVLDWAYGRIIAVHLEPRGASYAGRGQTYVKGRPFNVTDLDFGPDGAMYVVTGGRKTQSGLYRIRYTGDAQTVAPQVTPQQTSRRSHAKRNRQLRHKLESLYEQKSGKSLGEAWPHLNDSDPWIRYAARTAVEQQSIASWRQQALEETRPWAKLAAWMALARGGETRDRPALLEKLNRLEFNSLQPSQKLAALYIYDLCTVDIEALDDQLVSDTAQRIQSYCPDASDSINRRLSLLMARLKAPDAVAKTMHLLSDAIEQSSRMHYLFSLRNVRKGWTDTERRDYFTAMAESSSYRGGQGMPEFLQKIREEALSGLNDQQRSAAIAVLDRTEDMTAVATEPLEQRPLIKKWTVAELVNKLPKSSRSSDMSNGREMFHTALCSRCHRLGSIGRLLGPDITSAARRFSRRDMLLHIIEPSQIVAEDYRNVQVETVDGRVITGRVVTSGDFRSPSLRIATNWLNPGETVELSKQQISVHEWSPVSPMPNGLLDTLTLTDIQDLLAFIESGGQPK